MAGGKIIKIPAGLSGLFQKKAELEFLVAHDTRIWGFTLQVFVSKILDDMVLIFLPQIDGVKRYLQFLTDSGGGFDIFFFAGAVTGMPGGFIKTQCIIINLHREAANGIILLFQ